MAIQGKKAKEVVSVFDPDRNAWSEVSIDSLKKRLESLGFTAGQIEAKIAELKGEEE